VPQEQFKVLTPAPDGILDTFTVGIAYAPGSTVLYWDGINQLHKLGNPWSETDASTGEIKITSVILPKSGDQLFLRFVDTTPIPIASEITELEGTVDETDDLFGELSSLLASSKPCSSSTAPSTTSKH
jgi:hypothetical protein